MQAGPPSAPDQQGGGLPPELMALMAQSQASGNPAEEGDDPGMNDSPGKKIDQSIVVYMTSDMGPFRCDNCVNWVDPNQCAVVTGVIDPAGCCNVFEAPQGVGDKEQAEEDYSADDPEAQAKPEPEQEPS